MYIFTVFSESENSNGEDQDSYGIMIFKDKILLKSVSSISYLKEKAYSFAEMCTRCQVSPVNFDDVLEDFLSV